MVVDFDELIAALKQRNREKRAIMCSEIANKVTDGSCDFRWRAAWDGACVALGGDLAVEHP